MQAWDYHNQTKHSPESVRRNVHFLDWENRPLPFKIYPDPEPIPLPREMRQTGVAALSAIAVCNVPERNVTPDLAAVASLLFFSAGVTRRRQYPGGEMLYRAAACTGALYEIELYLACGELPDLAAGVYHFNPGDFSLRRLREGDFRGVLVAAASEDRAIEHAPAVLIASGIYWRNAWKYQARTYRHFGWDNGTLTANLLAMAAAQGLPAKLFHRFADGQVNGLLDLDTNREVALSLVSVGYSDKRAPAAVAAPPLNLETVPMSREEVDYPLMRAMHLASSLTEAPARAVETACSNKLKHVPQVTDTIEEVVLRRGSSRRFTGEAISIEALSTILESATCGIPADFPSMNGIYLIVNRVDGLQQGSYFYNRGEMQILEAGDFRDRAAFLALEQQLAGDAAVAVFFLADLNYWLGRLGDRGYRAVQLEAGILGGKMYLAAYALRLGATGLTFYDDEVVQFFSPHAAGKSAIFLTALGQPAKSTLT
jgi:SagB-type dehydrogenase family enzyme